MKSRKVILSLRIPCPHCDTVCYVKTYRHKLIAFECVGCARTVVVCDRLLLTVPTEKFLQIEYMFGTDVCGRVQSADFKSRYGFRNVISDEDVEKVKKALDSDDLLFNLGDI
jgi:hypothetical protein